MLLYDSFGIYAVEDLEDERISYIGIALIPGKTAFPTREPFLGRLILNDQLLKAGMKSRELPLKGQMNFVRGIGSVWKYAHDNGYVELDMAKLKGLRHRASEPVLVCVTHSFLQN